ncbi:MAG: hypothetical protein HRT87_12075 [Legionellales bacterium]|nr:hypothetical protein [Legionellales bacterium]
MDLDKIINSIYDIEKDCKCDDCKKAIKNRKWLKRKFKEYYKSKVNVALDDVSKCLHPYKKVVSGDDGMYCTECNKYITTF